jgi:hypothetical protein
MLLAVENLAVEGTDVLKYRGYRVAEILPRRRT